MYKYTTTVTDEFLRSEYIQEDGSRAVLKRADPEYLIDLDGEVTAWFDEVKEAVKCQNEDDLCAAMFSKPTKAVLAGFLKDVCLILRKQNEMVRDLKACNDLLKTEVIGTQSSVIKLQDELIKSNTEQLQSLQTAVKTTVHNTVQEEIRTYSNVVSEKTRTPAPAFTPETLKRAFKDVVEEEDRSRNLMVFGLREEPDEERLTDKVCQLFQQLGEKPRVEATRVGNRATGKSRPVKVTLSSSTIAHQILRKASNLRNVEHLKSGFISQDRTVEQRTVHRELVLDLKKRSAREPDKRHFIRAGKVCSTFKLGI